MSSSARARPEDTPQLIDARYEVERALGRGGMSIVYAVRDRNTGVRYALKQIEAHDDAQRALHAAQLQHEYAILGQLSHPSIIKVYDYGVVDARPYYTMELLEGSDVAGLAPLPPLQVCRLLREIASALALLHSRRVLHRDTTASNVRLDANLNAKLIDFGAMAHMGAAEHVIGTPPYIPPEVFHGLALDGRVDLYALGALAYFALTRRHAYPARSLRELRDQWQNRPRPPSDYVADMPAGLDELVLSLLDLDAGVRPSNAAEVIERASAIARLPSDRRLDVAQSYLTTPALVGREPQLQRARPYLERAAHGQGSALLIEADAGLGRTRLLASFGLEARLGGALAMRVSAKGQTQVEFGVARAVVRQLLELAPELTLAAAHPHAALLGHVSPELHEALGQPELASSADRVRLHSQLSAALHALVCELARTRSLMIAVDDVDDADERSLSWLVELARAAQSRRLGIATTARSGASARAGRAFDLLSTASVRIALEPLSPEEVEALLSSLFGEVRNLNVVTRWVNGLAQGNPEAAMSLAQHLVDRELARYEGGTWILPGNECQQIMPRSLRDAWGARVDGLSPHARALAETLALIPENEGIDLARDLDLLRDMPALQLHAALDQLVARWVLIAASGRYDFAQAEVAAVVRERIDPERRRQLHRGLSAVYLARGQLLIAAHHLQQAGDRAEASQITLRWCTSRSQGRAEDRVFWTTSRGFDVLQGALEFAEAHGGSAHTLFLLRRQLLQVSVSVAIPFAPIAERVLERLRIDTGSALFRGDPNADPQTLAREYLTLAQAHYEAASESERGLSPFDALRELATVTVMLCGAYGRQLDIEAIVGLLPLLAPFRGLGPLLQLLYDITNAAADRARGRRFSDCVLPLLSQLETPVSGLDEVTRNGAQRILTYYLALERAQLGSAAVLAHADFIAEEPAFEPLAWHVRMVKHLYSGEALRAEACRERTELLSLRNPDTLNQLATSILYETEAHTLSADMLALKSALPQLERLAQHSAGWHAFYQTVSGEYEMLRGNHERACQHFELVLSLARPGAHTAWSRTASSHVANLVAMGAHERAIAFGEDACGKSAEHRVNPLYSVLIRASVARAYAERGEHARARSEIEHVLREANELEMTGIPLGCLYEAEARVALCAHENERFERALECARTHYAQGGSEPAAAKHRRLLSDALRRWAPPSAPIEADDSLTLHSDGVTLAFTRQWTTGQNTRERAEIALSAVLAECGAEGGGLFAARAGSLQLMAASGELSHAELGELADDQLRRALQAQEETVVAYSPLSTTFDADKPVLLTTPVESRKMIVGVMVLTNLPPDHSLPWSLLQAVSRALLDSGEVEPIALPEG